MSDRTFLLHLGGKLRVEPKTPIRTRDDLSMAYTPGVARICRAIADDPAKVWNLTIKQNAVAVVTDGTAVLGLGDIGPEAALPVMEGKAALFKEFGGVDAWPICLATTDPDEIVAVVTAIAPVFGGINLEDISAPRCFEIEERLRDDARHPGLPRRPARHGRRRPRCPAERAARRRQADLEECRVVVTGVGAAGVATTKMLLAAGVARRDRLRPPRRALRGPPGSRRAEGGVRGADTNPRRLAGTPDDALAGADVFIGLSGPGAVIGGRHRARWPTARSSSRWRIRRPRSPRRRSRAWLRSSAPAARTTRTRSTTCSRSPGSSAAPSTSAPATITEAMKLAAAHAIAAVVQPAELAPDYVIPSVFDRKVAPAVAHAVACAATESGVARRT